MASTEKLQRVKYGALIPAHDGGRAFFIVRPNLLRLFKDCGKSFNYIPHGSEIYVISRTITQKENDAVYQRWLKWHNSGGAKRRKAARKRAGR